MSKHRNMVFWLCVPIAACSSKSLNQNKASHSSSTDIQTSTSQQWLRQQNAWYTDSSESTYTLLLKPKGIFSFDLQKGFTGTAEELQLNGQHLRQQQIHVKQQEAQNTHMEQQTQQSVAQQEQAKAKALVKKHANLWPYLLLAIAIAMWYYGYKRSR